LRHKLEKAVWLTCLARLEKQPLHEKIIRLIELFIINAFTNPNNNFKVLNHFQSAKRARLQKRAFLFQAKLVRKTNIFS
jgi:hypothetical protein